MKLSSRPPLLLRMKHPWMGSNGTEEETVGLDSKQDHYVCPKQSCTGYEYLTLDPPWMGSY